MSETINYLPNLNALDPKQQWGGGVQKVLICITQYINKPYVFNEEEKI